MERFLSPYAYVGYHCNNNCIFCSESDEEYLRAIGGPITTEKAKDDLRKIRGVYDFVSFMGREPTLRKDLPELISYASGLGFKNINIATNGRIFAYDDYAKKMIESGVTQIGMSFYSHIPGHYDEQAGIKDGYEQALAGMKNIIKYGRGKISFLVNIPLNKKNAPDLEETINLLLSLGVKEINILFIAPLSKKSMSTDIVGKMSDLGDLAARMAIKYGGEAKFWLNEFLPCSLKKEYRDLFFNCFEKNPHKKRIPLCDRCEYKDRCDGILSTYMELYGEDEFNLN